MTMIVSRTLTRTSATSETITVAARIAGRMNRPMPPNTTRWRPNSCRRGLVRVPKERGDPLAAANAHRDDSPFGLPPFELVGQFHREDGPGGAHRMAEGDGAAVRVDLLGVDFELADDGHRLGGEGFVQLHEIDIVDRHADFLEQFLHGEDGGHAHDL